MKEYHVSLRELSEIIKMTQMGIGRVIKGIGASENPKYVKKGYSNNKIEVKAAPSNKKTVELNKFIKEHKMMEFEDIDYVNYLVTEINKSEFINYIGEYCTTSDLKKIFHLDDIQIKNIQDKKLYTEIKKTNGIRTRKKYLIDDILIYLPDSIMYYKIEPLFYTIQEITDLINEKHGLNIRKLTVNRKIMNFPAIRIRNSIRVSIPLFDKMTTAEIENIFNSIKNK